MVGTSRTQLPKPLPPMSALGLISSRSILWRCGFGIGVAGVPGAVGRNGLVLDKRIAECGSLADRRGAGGDGQKVPPIDIRVPFRSAVGRLLIGTLLPSVAASFSC